MVTYKLFNSKLTDLVRVEVVYESYPVISGADEVSALIRFRYTGEIKKDEAKPDSEDPEPKNNPDTSLETPTSTLGRISSQLSNATRALFLQQFEKDDQNEQDRTDVTLYLGYCQIFGYYTVDDEIVDYTKFEQTAKSTIIGGKYAGIDGLEEQGEAVSKLTGDKRHVIPFYSTTQKIMFSELTFDPSQWDFTTMRISPVNDQTTRSFYANVTLPKDLPPSFASEAGEIGYKMVIGYQLKEGANFVHKSVMIPLKVQPYVDKFGRTPLFQLDKVRINDKPERMVISDMRTRASSRHMTKMSFNGMRKNSIGNIEAFQTARSVTKSHGLGIIPGSSHFMEYARKLSVASVNDVRKVQQEFDEENSKGEVESYQPRDNVAHIIADYRSIQKEKLDGDVDGEDQPKWVWNVPESERTRFLIRQGKREVASLELDKAIVKVGDWLQMKLDFEGCELATKGLEVQLVRSQVFYKEEYLKLGSYDEVNERISQDHNLEVVMFEKLVSTFDCMSVSSSLLIPATCEPQFKTNYYQVKYFVQVRFVLLNQKGDDNDDETEDPESFDLQQIFVDKSGSILFKAREDFDDGTEFTVRVPIVMLPNYEQDFGGIETGDGSF